MVSLVSLTFDVDLLLRLFKTTMEVSSIEDNEELTLEACELLKNLIVKHLLTEFALF
jgi:hypothetical protein